jgi:Family of unknown function (DUF6521)
MIVWDRRPIEIASLLNPAFCGEVIRQCIESYQKTESQPFPFPLVYLILPIVLHKKTRETIVAQRQLHVWLQANENVKIGFADRTRELVPITKEAMIFLLQVGAIEVDEQAGLHVVSYQRRIPPSQPEGEISDCYRTAVVIGRWFARAANVPTIYALWGVRP